MTMSPRAIAGAALSFIAGAACLGLYVSRPRSLEDCILNGITGGMSNHAVAARREACENKFAKAEFPVKLSDADIQSLKGTLAINDNGYAQINLYNGSSSIDVRSVTIYVAPPTGIDSPKDGLSPPLLYTVDVKVASLSTASKSFYVMTTGYPRTPVWGSSPEVKYAWGITGAFGIPTETTSALGFLDPATKHEPVDWSKFAPIDDQARDASSKPVSDKTDEPKFDWEAK